MCLYIVEMMIEIGANGIVSRRNALKIIASSTVAGTGLFSMQTSASDPTGQPVTTEETKLPNPDLKVRQIDRSVKAVTHKYPLLTLPKETVLRYINESDLSGDDKQDARVALSKLRSRYPIEEVEDGNTIWLTLADSSRVSSRSGDDNHSHSGTSVHTHLDGEDRDLFDTAFTAFARGTTSEQVGIDFFHETHRDMTRHACNEMGIDPSGIADHADDPDKPQTDLGVPSGVPHSQKINEGIKKAFNELMHHYGQYYDANLFQSYDCSHDGTHSSDFGGFGGAPLAALWHANEAQSTTGSTHRMRVGHLTHYPQDMGVPLHTGMGWEQANFELSFNFTTLSVEYSFNSMDWLHSEYERYVANNWDSGENFSVQFGSDQCDPGHYCYYVINDVEQAIKDEASTTGQWSNEVFTRIMEEGDVGWENWSQANKDYMRDITENCVHEAGLYTRGFIERFL